MIDPLAWPNFVAFSAQTAIIALVALVLPGLFRITAAGFRYTFWRLILLVCLLMPLLQTPRAVPAEARDPFASGPQASDMAPPAAPAASRSADVTLMVMVLVVAGAL